MDRELDRLFRGGAAPSVDELVGRELAGRNLHPLARALGVERFQKGFFRDGAAGRAYGYNRLSAARGLARLPAALLAGRRFAFFEVVPAAELPAPAHPHALAIRYAGWPRRRRASPLGLVVDYLVRAEAPRELLVGKAYLERRARRVFLEHFLLEPEGESSVSPERSSSSP